MLYKIFIFCLQLIPLKTLHSGGDFLAFLWLKVFGIRKDVILENLKKAMPELTEEQKQWIAKSSVQNLTRSFTHLLLVPRLDETWMQEHVEFVGFENYVKARQQNKGIYFLTLHMGSGDLAMSSMVLKGIPTVLISKVMKNKWVQTFWSKIRTTQGLEIIDPHSPQNAFQILSAIKHNKAVVFVLDQYMGPPYGIKSRFFGIETGSAYGLSVFVKKTKSPVLPIYTYWESDKLMKVVIEPAMELNLDSEESQAESKEQSILRLTEAFNKKIEDIIRKYPQHWMWVHKRWKVFR